MTMTNKPIKNQAKTKILTLGGAIKKEWRAIYKLSSYLGVGMGW